MLPPFARFALPILLLAAAGSRAGAAGPVVPNWPQFRGPGGNAIAAGQTVPLEFGPDRHRRWSVPLPPGHSSPSIWGDRIFLTGHEGNLLKMFCLRRSDGLILWERSRPVNKIAPYQHIAGSPANATPATDGQRVCFLFDDYGVVVTDLGGGLQWEKKFPPTGNSYSYGASPVLDDGRLYLNRDGGLDSSLVCLEAATGTEIWRAPRERAIVSFCTPYVWSDGNAKHILAGGSGKLEAYEALTGAPVWNVTGLPTFVCPSPVSADGMIFFGGWTTAHVTGRTRIDSAFGEESGLTAKELESPQAFFDRFDRNKDGRLEVSELPESRARDAFNFLDKNKNGFVDMDELARMYSDTGAAPGRNVVLGIAAGGRGDVTSTHVRWEALKGLPYVASPVIDRGRVYLVKAGGFLTCLDAVTGRAHYESQRLGVSSEYYATPVVVGDHLLVCALRGTIFAIKAGDKFEIVARNVLGEEIYATPAVADNTLYVRGEKNLWAFGEQVVQPSPQPPEPIPAGR